MRRGFTLLELGIATAIAVAVMATVYESFIASSRGMVRAESRLNYLMDSNLVFLSIRRDLHTELAPAAVQGGALVIQRYQAWQSPFKLTTHTVQYQFVADHAGGSGGAVLRRVTAGTPGPEGAEMQFGEGTVKAFSASTKTVGSRTAVMVHLVFRSPHDAVDVVFDRLFVPQETKLDPTWRPVP